MFFFEEEAQSTNPSQITNMLSTVEKTLIDLKQFVDEQNRIPIVDLDQYCPRLYKFLNENGIIDEIFYPSGGGDAADSIEVMAAMNSFGSIKEELLYFTLSLLSELAVEFAKNFPRSINVFEAVAWNIINFMTYDKASGEPRWEDKRYHLSGAATEVSIALTVMGRCQKFDINASRTEAIE